ncbi:MAG TPA: twin-arginine translocation signal domain-containing protein [Bacteroides sp.]|nr:twin-arginine translocation signal domain-containing protein [Bacteroides sp.]
MMQTRRSFVKNAAMGAAALSVTPAAFSNLSERYSPDESLFFKISLAEWSLNQTLFSGKLDNLDFPAYTKKNFDIHALEYVNQFFPSSSKEYAEELLKRTIDLNMNNVLIMIDEEGDLGDQYEPKRRRAVERHFEWIECAEVLGCHSIRVNAAGRGTEEGVAAAVVRSLTELCRFAEDHAIHVIVENHGGYSSSGQWLAAIMKEVNMDNCGTLPDFGNFRISGTKTYDRYLGVKELMPYAKGVSAKSHDFDEQGHETQSDFFRLLKIVKEAGYRGYIGIEYEGRRLDEHAGIIATRDLLIKAGKSI